MEKNKHYICRIVIIAMVVSSLAFIPGEDTFAKSKKKKTIKITFVKNGGKLSKKSKKVKVGKKYGKLPIPKRSGYTFKGWYTKKNGGKKITAKSKVKKKKKHKLYAKWAKKINYASYRSEVFAIVNKERTNFGGNPLEWSPEIAMYANTRAKEISLYFNHYRPNGLLFNSLNPALLHGENIAAGHNTPKSVMKSWMNSPGHKSNILYPDYKYIGVGFYMDKKAPVGKKYYWVQLFSYGENFY